MMMLITNDILATPLLLLMYALDLYVCLVALRLMLGPMPGAWAGRVRFGLQAIADPPFGWTERRLRSWRKKQPPAWATWLVVLLGVFVLRHVLLIVFIQFT